MADDNDYFSDRERGPRQRTEEVIPLRVWGGLHALIQARIDDGSFGFRYPAACPDGGGPYGTDWAMFWRAAKAEIPDMPEDPRVRDVSPVTAELTGTYVDSHSSFGS